MLIGHYGRFGRVAEFDTDTGVVGTSRAARTGERPAGMYEVLAGTLVVLYREAGQLVVRIADHRIPFDGARVRHEIGERHCTLLVGEVTVRYPVPEELSGLADDMTPFVEAEDFDFGLFLAEVARDADRAGRILQ